MANFFSVPFKFVVGNLLLASMLALSYSYLRIVFPVLPFINKLDIWFAVSCISTAMPSTAQWLWGVLDDSVRRGKNPEHADHLVWQSFVSVFLYSFMMFLLWIDYLIYCWLK